MRMILAMVVALPLLALQPLVALSRADPGDHAVHIVVVPPWRDAAEVVARAGGHLIGPATAPFAVLAQGSTPGFAAAVQARGAWLVLDAQTLLMLCGA